MGRAHGRPRPPRPALPPPPPRPPAFLALSAAVRPARHLPPNLAPLPVLQALTLAAADGKLPASEHRRRTAVAGEISHLTRSFEYAVRTGAFGDAVSIFSGLLREGRERVMAGDVLFRVAAEDMAMAGHKLIYAVKGWQLASALGWRAGDVVMGPAVARVATGVQDPAAFRTLMAAGGRGGGGRRSPSPPSAATRAPGRVRSGPRSERRCARRRRTRARPGSC